MSLFRKPKKAIQRRVFSTNDDEESDSLDVVGSYDSGKLDTTNSSSLNKSERPDRTDRKERNHEKKIKNDLDHKQIKTNSLLSFVNDDEEDEIFQVRKSSHSKKVMRMMDKERRKKKAKHGREYSHQDSANGYDAHVDDANQNDNDDAFKSGGDQKHSAGIGGTSSEQSKNKKSDNIQTEIRTDDFVLVVKKSEPEIIVNGRAALCIGRDDMSDEDDARNSGEENGERHVFTKPEQLKQILESGSIPDAAMIHAARKRRQKAREQGDVIPIDNPKDPPKKGKRLTREGVEGENSDEEERVDMNAITGMKELEERREQFYSVENDYSDDDSDHETNEWENQQIRKGVTGAQLVTAQQESVLSRFVIKTAGNQFENTSQLSTSSLLDEAYAKNSLEKPRQLISNKRKKEAKASVLRTPQEITESLRTRLVNLKELNSKHQSDIDKISEEIKVLKLEKLDCSQKAPSAAAKYRFYQEINGYVINLIECLSEKTPKIAELEKHALTVLSRHPTYLIERRRQDVRDQVKEMAESSSKCLGSATRRGPDYEDIIKRTAERECRRTRRRCEREKKNMSNTHLDGMSSDDEVSDRFMEQNGLSIDQLEVEVDDLFADASEEFFKVEQILSKFHIWRKTDFESYKDAYVSLCLPKLLGPLVRTELMVWNPLTEKYKDIEDMNWYTSCMLYGWSESETEKSLLADPDVKLVPAIIEKVLLPKITEIVTSCWDPVSTTQNLRLIGLVNRIGRDYPIRELSPPLKQLFQAVLDKMKTSLDNDVFIPIFPKQVQEARTSFFQRQFCCGLKLFHNFLSWQGIIADKPLRELALSSLLNRYLLLAIRVCATNDALSKAYIVVNTLPTVWLQPDSEALKNLQPLISYIKTLVESIDTKNPLNMQSYDKAKQILQRLHSW